MSQSSDVTGASPSPVFGRIRGLDGLRAIAVLLVLGYHAHLGGFGGGYGGVDIFFVLSGFLITSLLIVEFDTTGGIHLKHFWIRRALRLLPALGAVIALSVVIVVAQREFLNFSMDTVSKTLITIPFALLYSTNIMRVFGFNGNGGYLAHTWSLSVEEQFYIFWPLFTVYVLRRSGVRALARWSLALFVASAGAAAAAIVAGVSVGVVENLTFTRAYGMFLGCALAAVIRTPVNPSIRRAVCNNAVPVVSLGAIAAIVVIGDYGDLWMYAAGLPAVVVATTALVAHLNWSQDGWLANIMEMRAPVEIGRRSYGLYLYHYPIFLAVGATPDRPVRIAIGVVGTFIAAWLSFRFIETPVQRLRRKYVVGAETSAAVASPAEAVE